MQGFDLTDDQWLAIQPLLPQKSPRGGRPWKDHRTMINGMLWIEKSGGRWRDLPAQYGPWQSVYDRYTNWRSIGLWDRILLAIPMLEEDLVHSGSGFDGASFDGASAANPITTGSQAGEYNRLGVRS